MGFLDWCLDHVLLKNGSLIRENPIPFATFGLLVCVGTIVACRYYYSDTVELLERRLVTANEIAQRYRMSAGIDRPDSRTRLSILTNIELREKGRNLVKRIREIRSIYERNTHGIDSESIDPKKPDDMKRWLKEIKSGDRLMQEVRVDASLIIEEMRDRLSPEIRERVMKSLPHIQTDYSPDSDVLFWKTQLAGGILIGFADVIADEIEELTKLLPDTLEKRPS